MRSKWYTALLVIALTMSLIHWPIQLHSDIKYSLIEDGIYYSKYLADKHVLSNSYYMKYIGLPVGTSFKDSMVRDYFVLDIDKDAYPDLLIWYPTKLIVWSISKGVYAFYYAGINMYISRPIPVDVDKDGVTDYVVVVENSYLDARIYSRSELNSIKSTVTIWYPNTGYKRLLKTYRGIFIVTTTYYFYNRKLFIPTVVNYYVSNGFYYKKFYSKIGLFMLDTKTLNTRLYNIKTYYTNYLYDPGLPNTNDYTTNYEVYITGILNHMFIITMGLDKIIRVAYKSGSISILREATIGPSRWTDNQIVVARREPAVSVAGYTSNPGTMTNYWRSPQRLQMIFSFGDLVIPLGKFVYQSPARSENGIYFRIERITGVLVYDTYYNRIYTRTILGRGIWVNNVLYTIVAITSIVPDRYGLYLYVGVLAYSSNNKLVSALIKYDWRGDRIYLIWSKKIPGDRRRFQVTVNRLGNEVYAVNLNTFYANGVELLFHVNKYYPVVPQYTVYPPATINPRKFDIDGDGVNEYVFIMYYCDYTPYSYYPYGVMGMHPKVYNNRAFIVWFDKPVVYTNFNCTDETCRYLETIIYYESTKISYGYLMVENAYGVVIYKDRFYGGKQYSNTIVFDNVGTYYIDLILYTRYRINEWIDGGNIPDTITYIKKLDNIYIVNVRYKTRIILLKPKLNILTPNLYINGLSVTFKLQYLDFKSNTWKELPRQKPVLRVGIRNETITYEFFPYDLGNGVYNYVFTYVKYPGSYEIYVKYQGTTYYAPTKLTKSIFLIKYPVEINMRYFMQYPALTTYTISLNLTYSYIVEDGTWFSSRLNNGILELKVYNTTMNKYELVSNYTVEINSSSMQISINKYIVLPGNYSFIVKYVATSIYYEEKVLSGNYTVNKLRLYVDIIDLMDNTSLENDTIVIYGSPLLINTREYIENTTWRNLSVPLRVVFNSENNGYIFNINGVSIIDTSEIKPSNYTVVIYPQNYSFVYEPNMYRFNVSIIKPYARIIVKTMPSIIHNFSNEKLEDYIVLNKSTYTLVPVKIALNTYIIPPVIMDEALVKVIIDDKVYTLKPGNRSITWIPIEPGYKEITTILETRYIRIINKTYLTVYPMPVKINVSRGSIIVETKDILGRPAEGLIRIEVYDLEKNLLIGKTFYTNGTLVIKDPRLYGWVYVRVYFKGNGSYLPAVKQKLLYLGSRDYYVAKPLPEPSYIGGVMIISLITIILLRRTRQR